MTVIPALPSEAMTIAAVFWLVGVSAKLKTSVGAASPDSAISFFASSGSPLSGTVLPEEVAVQNPVGA